jgi:hypothetical protein
VLGTTLYLLELDANTFTRRGKALNKHLTMPGNLETKKICSSLMEGTRYAGFFDPVLLLTRKRKLQATSPSSLIEKPKRGEAHEESNIWYKTNHKCCLLCGGSGGTN